MTSLSQATTCLLFWTYYQVLTQTFVLYWHSLHWRILIMLQFSIDLPISSKGMFFFIRQIIFLLINMVMVIISEIYIQEDIFDLAVLLFLLLLVNIVSGFRLEVIHIYLYVHHQKYQVKPHLHGFHLLVLLSLLIKVFCLYQQNMCFLKSLQNSS